MAARWLTVARLVKTQGRRGEVAAEILTDFPERLAARREVWLWDGRDEPRPVGVERAWPHKSFLVFQFAGCRVVEQASGRELGRVRELVATGGTPLLAVETPEGKELLIPFAEEYCPRIAPAEKLIEVVLPEGLRELNE